MGFPDIKDYYVAVILDQIRHWYTPSFNKQWRHIEQLFVIEGDLSSLLLAQSMANVSPKATHTTISAALLAWKVFSEKLLQRLATSISQFH